MNFVTKDDPRVKPYTKLKYTLTRPPKNDDAFFIADGEKTVLRLLESKLEVKSILCREKHYHRYKDAFFQNNLSGDQILIAEKKEMAKIVGYSVHQGFMAMAQKPPYHDWKNFGPPILMLNNVRDAENVGAIVRTALAFDIKNLIFDKGSCSPYIRRSVRVAMGYTFKMNIANCEDLKEVIPWLQEKGIIILGSSAKDHQGIPATSLFEYKFSKELALILGNEGYGLDKKIISLCDDLIRIPMAGGVASLNIAASLSAMLAVAHLGSA